MLISRNTTFTEDTFSMITSLEQIKRRELQQG